MKPTIRDRVGRVSDTTKLHRYMLTFLAVFKTPNGAPATKYINTTVNRQHKTLPLGLIKQGQDSVAMHLQYFGVSAENISDVTFLSASYLGLMSEKEFTYGLSNEQAASVDLGSDSGEGSNDEGVSARPNPFEIN